MKGFLKLRPSSENKNLSPKFPWNLCFFYNSVQLIKRNWVVATNSSVLIPITLQPDDVILWHFKLILLYLSKFIARNIKGLRCKDIGIISKIVLSRKFKRVTLNKTPEIPFWGLTICVDFNFKKLENKKRM